MGWSAKFARIAGIDLYVHATFPLLFVWVGFVYYVQTGTLEGVLFGFIFIAVLFLCVVLHEYGHALTARRYGIGTRHITLLPIGGVANLEKMPKDPRQEIVVALMGPAVNVAIAAVLFLIVGLPGEEELLAPSLEPAAFARAVLTANIFLAVFNMIPAFPMDGGRVLRAILSFRSDRVTATRWAARVGQTLALGFGILGLFAGNLILVLIAFFIWIGAAAEASSAEVETRLHRKPVERAMITDFQTLSPNDPLSSAIDLTLAGTQKDFPVVEGSRVVGALTQSAILKGLRDLGPDGRISEVMGPAATADIKSHLTDLLEDLQQSEARLICIMRRNELVGFVDLDNISEFLRIQQALQEH